MSCLIASIVNSLFVYLVHDFVYCVHNITSCIWQGKRAFSRMQSPGPRHAYCTGRWTLYVQDHQLSLSQPWPQGLERGASRQNFQQSRRGGHTETCIGQGQWSTTSPTARRWSIQRVEASQKGYEGKSMGIFGFSLGMQPGGAGSIGLFWSQGQRSLHPTQSSGQSKRHLLPDQSGDWGRLAKPISVLSVLSVLTVYFVHRSEGSFQPLVWSGWTGSRAENAHSGLGNTVWDRKVANFYFWSGWSQHSYQKQEKKTNNSTKFTTFTGPTCTGPPARQTRHKFHVSDHLPCLRVVLCSKN